MEFRKALNIMKQVPDYSVFLTVDELKASAHALARKYPKVVQIQDAGKSRQGDPIEVIKIGDGPKKALLFAMPHPNEPIGSMMLEYFSERLAADEALRNELGYTWFLIKCIDPDGTRLNEGWFKGPFTIENYAQHYYRPPGFQQIEWTFPIDYKTLHFNDPLPETRVLMGLIEREKFDFAFSLHNAGFGGVYYYLTQKAPALYKPFHRLAESQDLPLHLGEPEVPWAEAYAPAIFQLMRVADGYDFMLSHTGKDPAEVMKQGASSAEYAARFGDTFGLVCEMPYFYNPAIRDTSPTTSIRRDVILAGIADERKEHAQLQAIYDSIAAELTTKSPFRDTIEHSLKSAPANMDSSEAWAKSDPSTAKPATVAEKFDSEVARPVYHLLGLGMVVRMIDTQIAATGATPALTKARKDARALFDRRVKSLASLKYEVIPIKKLAGVQLGACLLTADYVRRRKK